MLIVFKHHRAVSLRRNKMVLKNFIIIVTFLVFLQCYILFYKVSLIKDSYEQNWKKNKCINYAHLKIQRYESDF